MDIELIEMSISPSCIGDPERFLRRGNDKTHRHCLKRRERISKAYQSNPMDILKVIHDDHLLFHVKSKSSYDT